MTLALPFCALAGTLDGAQSPSRRAFQKAGNKLSSYRRGWFGTSRPEGGSRTTTTAHNGESSLTMDDDLPHVGESARYMRGLSLVDFLNGPATRGPRFRSGRSGVGGRLKHALKYRRSGDSPVMQAWEVPNNGDDSKLNGIDLISSFAFLNGAEYVDHFTYVPHPEEPDDLDKPVRCPPPEPCIMHDGRVFRDRLTPSRRRTSDPLGSMRETDHLEYYSTPPNRRRSAGGSKETIQTPALIAPDLVATKIVD